MTPTAFAAVFAGEFPEMEINMMEQESRTSEDVTHVRNELIQTVHEVALSLSKRARDPGVLLDISADLIAEARKLRVLGA